MKLLNMSENEITQYERMKYIRAVVGYAVHQVLCRVRCHAWVHQVAETGGAGCVGPPGTSPVGLPHMGPPGAVPSWGLLCRVRCHAWVHQVAETGGAGCVGPPGAVPTCHMSVCHTWVHQVPCRRATCGSTRCRADMPRVGLPHMGPPSAVPSWSLPRMGPPKRKEGRKKSLTALAEEESASCQWMSTCIPSSLAF